jgi:hypothetical protein
MNEQKVEGRTTKLAAMIALIKLGGNEMYENEIEKQFRIVGTEGLPSNRTYRDPMF